MTRIVMLVTIPYTATLATILPFSSSKVRSLFCTSTVIGTRTWGGLVGLSGNAGFADGGSLNVPTFGLFDENGEWVVEGVGVYPDIEVIDSPEKIAKGQDPTIEKAVEVLLKELEKNPVKKLKIPEDPDRKNWYEKEIK